MGLFFLGLVIGLVAGIGIMLVSLHMAATADKDESSISSPHRQQSD